MSKLTPRMMETAVALMPTSDAGRVTEGGRDARNVEGVSFVRAEDGAGVFAVGSGRYRFESALRD
jgi:hypothetical protein